VQTIKVFGHNESRRAGGPTRLDRGDKMVVTEGVFSMDGDFSALDQICCLAKDYGLLF